MVVVGVSHVVLHVHVVVAMVVEAVGRRRPASTAPESVARVNGGIVRVDAIVSLIVVGVLHVVVHVHLVVSVVVEVLEPRVVIVDAGVLDGVAEATGRKTSRGVLPMSVLP